MQPCRCVRCGCGKKAAKTKPLTEYPLELGDEAVMAVTCANAAALEWFNRGYTWFWGFHMEES